MSQALRKITGNIKTQLPGDLYQQIV